MKLLRGTFHKMIEASKSQSLVLFGCGEEQMNLCRKLGLVGVHVKYFVTTETDPIAEDIEVKHYTELLYENVDSILVLYFTPEQEFLLNELGLRSPLNYRHASSVSYCPPQHFVLDPNLGYAKMGNCEYPGFVQFGSSNAIHTIVTLGGSTTDASLTDFKSWSELLYELCEGNGHSVRILCGGISGYNSAQSLVKLIRDVMPINPDMIISFEGFNDVNNMFRDEKFPFVHPYQKEVMRTIGMKQNFYIYPTDGFSLGVDSGFDSYMVWKNSIKMMHAVCAEYKIEFRAVLQPTLYDKKTCMGKKDYEIMLHNELRDDLLKLFEKFEKQLENDGWKPDYVTDMRYIFSGIDGLYFDNCHVWEEGNRIIASEMYKQLNMDYFLSNVSSDCLRY